MNKQHWIVLGAFLLGLGQVVAALDQWSDALSPSFISGVLTMLGTVVRATFLAPLGPQEPPSNE